MCCNWAHKTHFGSSVLLTATIPPWTFLEMDASWRVLFFLDKGIQSTRIELTDDFAVRLWHRKLFIFVRFFTVCKRNTCVLANRNARNQPAKLELTWGTSTSFRLAPRVGAIIKSLMPFTFPEEPLPHENMVTIGVTICSFSGICIKETWPNSKFSNFDRKAVASQLPMQGYHNSFGIVSSQHAPRLVWEESHGGKEDNWKSMRQLCRLQTKLHRQLRTRQSIPPWARREWSLQPLLPSFWTCEVREWRTHVHPRQEQNLNSLKLSISLDMRLVRPNTHPFPCADLRCLLGDDLSVFPIGEPPRLLSSSTVGVFSRTSCSLHFMSWSFTTLLMAKGKRWWHAPKRVFLWTGNMSECR